MSAVVGGAETETETVTTMAGDLPSSQQNQNQNKRRWIKHYCDECEAWETREMFQVAKFGAPSASVWSWGCAKLVRHATFQSFRVEHLNNADGHDAALDFPSAITITPKSSDSPTQTAVHLETVHPPHPEHPHPEHPDSNGSSQQSKRPKRNTVVLAAAVNMSPVNSQGGVTSSSPDENGAAGSKDAGDAAGPESPAVIDAEQHENGIHKRPRRLTAGDRGLAQALQFERPRKVATKAVAEVNDVKPSQPSLAAAMKRPKRVTAGLKGIAIAAENAKSAPRQVSVKKEQKKDAVHQVNVQTRSASAKKPSKNKKLGDFY